MGRILKALVVIVSVAVLVYLVSSADISGAEDAEAAGQGQFADVTVSLEARVVVVELDALQETAGESDDQTLNTIPADKILQSIREGDGGEVVSAVKLAVGNDSLAEMTTEEGGREKVKNAGDETGMNSDRETHVSFLAEATVNDTDTIVVKFDFTQVVSESTSSASSDAGEEHDIVRKFEVS
ncbi:MAG: hypothetical protein PVJ86_12590, partial [Phycisphaerales bacterium]